MARTNLKDFGKGGATGKLPLSPNDRDIEEALGRMSRPSSRLGYRVVRLFAWTVAFGLIASTGVNVYNAAVTQRQVTTLEGMVTEQYNPSVKVRFSQLGGQVISAWYNGGSQPVALADGISWPASVPVTNKDQQGTTQQPQKGDKPQSGAANITTDQKSDQTQPQTKPLDGTPVVSNIAFVYGSQTKQPTEDHPNAYVESLTYSATVNGVLQYITILFRIDDLSDLALPALVAEPSLVNPDDVNAKIEADNGPKDLKNWNVSTEQLSQLDSWAKAYTTDDRATLKRLTGDTNKGDVFIGLVSGNWDYVPNSIKVVWAKSMNEPNNGYARVSWQIQEVVDSGVKDASGKATTKTYKQTMTMDLLVTNKETALLSVIEWGAAGSYEKLTKYGNALTEETAPAQKQRTSVSNNGSNSSGTGSSGSSAPSTNGGN